MGAGGRKQALVALEEEAETLVTYQLDLLAELERQIRAVHHTMRHIERLRSTTKRVGPELSNGQRADTLTVLAQELAALDAQIDTQHACCGDMVGVVKKMRQRLSALRKRTASRTSERPEEREEPVDSSR